MWGKISLLTLGRHHPAWDADLFQGAQPAITAPGSRDSHHREMLFWEQNAQRQLRQQHRREEAAPVGGTRNRQSTAL